MVAPSLFVVDDLLKKGDGFLNQFGSQGPTIRVVESPSTKDRDTATSGLGPSPERVSETFYRGPAGKIHCEVCGHGTVSVPVLDILAKHLFQSPLCRKPVPLQEAGSHQRWRRGLGGGGGRAEKIRNICKQAIVPIRGT